MLKYIKKTLFIITLLAGFSLLLGLGCQKAENANKAAEENAGNVNEEESENNAEITENFNTYMNEEYGYSLSFPDNVERVETGGDAYEDCCEKFYYKVDGVSLGYLLIVAPENVSDCRCFSTGFGYDGKEITEDLNIDGKEYVAKGFEEMGPGENLDYHNETLIVKLDDGTKMEFGSGSDANGNYADYLGIKEDLIKMVESYQKDTGSVNYQNENVEFISDYGFLLRYPKSYMENNDYSGWQSDQQSEQPVNIVGLLDCWGINVGQQTIISISVYPKDKKDEVLDYYDYSTKGEIEQIGNINGEKMYVKAGYNGEMLYGAITENGEYFYVIKSSFVNLPDYEEYNEYKSILDSIEFR